MIETIDVNQTSGLPEHIRMTCAGRLVLAGGAHDVAAAFLEQSLLAATQ